MSVESNESESRVFGPTWEQARGQSWSVQDDIQRNTYAMYPVEYTASPAELARWEAEGADHGVHGSDRVHLEMLHHALNPQEGAVPAIYELPDAMVMRLAGVTVEA